VYAKQQDQHWRHQRAAAHTGLPDQQANQEASDRIMRVNRNGHTVLAVLSQ